MSRNEFLLLFVLPLTCVSVSLISVASGRGYEAPRTLGAVGRDASVLWTWAAEHARPASSTTATVTTASVDWSKCPRLTLLEAKALLAPVYAEQLVATDGWGNLLEYCLRRDDPAAPFGVGVRSPGRDGAFEGNLYQRGELARGDVDSDIVWLDGKFVTWYPLPRGARVNGNDGTSDEGGRP